MVINIPKLVFEVHVHTIVESFVWVSFCLFFNLTFLWCKENAIKWSQIALNGAMRKGVESVLKEQVAAAL